MHVNPPGARDVARSFSSSFTCLLIGFGIISRHFIHSFIIYSCRVIGWAYISEVSTIFSSD